MSRPPEGPDSDLLFDLPLDRVADESPIDKALDEPGSSSGGHQAALIFSPEGEPEPARSRPAEAPLAARLKAWVLDLVVLLAALGFSLLALSLLEVPIDRRVVAPLAVFLGSFSFLYQVMPLAFWGHTPGMAYAGIHSRAKTGDFMTMQQCILRWIGWVLTAATAGLAALIALSGVSLSDLISRTRSYVRGR